MMMKAAKLGRALGRIGSMSRIEAERQIGGSKSKAGAGQEVEQGRSRTGGVAGQEREEEEQGRSERRTGVGAWQNTGITFL